MSIHYAILGILSYKQMSGYDLKKVIQDSSFMYWSGNNNQIYKALSELLDKGQVTSEVMHQEGSPTKKIYGITDAGLVALKEWVLSPIEPIDIKKPFLIQLAWSKQLNSKELKSLIDEYYNQVKEQLLLEKNKREDGFLPSDRTALESTIWNFIQDNIVRTYEHELVWIEELLEAISDLSNENDAAETDRVNEGEDDITEENREDLRPYRVVRTRGISYVHFIHSTNRFETERDISDLITAVVNHDTPFVLMDEGALSEKFFDHKSSLLAAFLQKFTMFNIKAAIRVKDISRLDSEYIDVIGEARQHDSIRLFEDIKDVEKWFLCLKQKGSSDYEIHIIRGG